jgi:hypothetical protein
MFSKIIDSLQEAAGNSVDLLAELAGLESYIAETYTQRCVTELLQNSDDAKSSKVVIFKADTDLVYLNNGSVFSERDFASLCTSALSSKQRGESIGYRGIGFKSVVNICDSVIVASNELKCVFDRAKTRSLLGTTANVPLIRVPHHLTQEERGLVQSILDDNADFATCFIFRGIDQDYLRQEIDSLTNEHFLFLKNLQSIQISTDAQSKPKSLVISRTDSLEYQSEGMAVKQVLISSSSDGTSSSWTVFSQSESSIAFISDNGIPSRLPSETALLHAYLPTQCPTGTGVRFNSDFSTDPSRTRLKYDDLTEKAIKAIAKIIYSLLSKYSNTSSTLFWQSCLDAIVPHANYKIYELQGNRFCGLLIKELSELVSKMPLDLHAIPQAFRGIEHLTSCFPNELCVFMPVSSSFNEAKNFLASIGIAALPSSAILKFYQEQENAIDPKCSSIFIRNLLSENFSIDAIGSMYIFPSRDRKCLRASDFLPGITTLDPVFVQELAEKLMSTRRVKELLTGMGFSPATIDELLPTREKNAMNMISLGKSLVSSKDELVNTTSADTGVQVRFLNEQEKSRYGVKDWRLAEELVAYHYRTLGCRVIDVSKANKGYDLEAIGDSGKLCIEIKKLGNPSREFTMTQNEFNESIFRGDSFILALVSPRDEGGMEIMFIANPYVELSAFTTKRAKAYEFYVSGFAYSPDVVYQ